MATPESFSKGPFDTAPVPDSLAPALDPPEEPTPLILLENQNYF
jgi:hypothetical protein